MRSPDTSPSSVYHYPRYYAIGYQWNTKAECDFLEACISTYLGSRSSPAAVASHHRRSTPSPKTPSNHQSVRLRSHTPPPFAVLDLGCGAGRHLLELAKRAYRVSGIDLRPEMIAYANEEAKKAGLSIAVAVGDLRHLTVQGPFDVALCLMDTFRFLLTNEEILQHLKQVSQQLAPGGLYVTDFWIPTRWDQIANEIYQWEQTQEDTTVRVFYLQHPDSIDPINQTFEDELVFVIEEEGRSKEIRGGRTRTRLIMPQEFQSLVQASGVFDLMGVFSDFDLAKPLEHSSLSWRMVSVLKKR